MLKDGTTVSRVSMCEACQRAPAAFLCKADAASLCSSCDNEIHSANPLAFKHHRMPILPIDHGFIGNNGYNQVEEECVDEEEAALWLLLNPVKNDDIESNWFLFEEDHDDDNQQHDYNCVLQKSFAVDKDISVEMQHQHAQYFQPGLEFDSSKAAFSYNRSISQSVSISSIDVGIVPESTASDASIFSHSEIPIGTTIDQFSGPIQMPSYLAPLDREARVLRYREKKKTRKFEKKIRYASRKAHAETRPRIKGRFVKETDAEAEDLYGVVPSF